MDDFLSKYQQFCIPIASSSVHFLQTPDQFYQKILKRISTSKRRIILATLYLGTGHKEQEIVNKLEIAQNENEDLRVGILLDYFRGTRSDANKRSSVSMLEKLTKNPNFAAYFFFTPEMRGFLKSLLPERVNEIIGVQHMKFFIFDDAIMISGANLSDQYFVNRQDRYVLIEDAPMLANFFHAVFDIISRHSLQLDQMGELKFCGDSTVHPLTGLSSEIQKSIKAEIEKLYEDSKYIALAQMQSKSTQNNACKPSETFVFPFLQMGAFKIDQEIQLLSRLFNNQNKDFDMTLMTAYFNLYDVYADLILTKCHFPVNIVFGSPKTNGFFGASGQAGQIPALYAQNILDFMRKVNDLRPDEITFKEWDRTDWTFHAKGLWIGSKNSGKLATIIGSSNYGYRSAHRDLEAQILLVTENENLKRRIVEERNSLLEYATTQDMNLFLKRNHFIPTWVKYVSRFFRNFF